jgi:hypothetical protein
VEKKIGKTAAMMVVTMAEFAQSYIAQARSSGRPRPTASSQPFFRSTIGSGSSSLVIQIVLSGPREVVVRGEDRATTDRS